MVGLSMLFCFFVFGNGNFHAGTSKVTIAQGEV